jgi:hypothetical protein
VLVKLFSMKNGKERVELEEIYGFEARVIGRED